MVHWINYASRQVLQKMKSFPLELMCLCIVSKICGTSGARIGTSWRSWILLSSLASALALESNEGKSSQTISSPRTSSQCCRSLWFQHKTSHCSTDFKLKCSLWTICCEVAHAHEQLLEVCQPLPALKVLTYTMKLRYCGMPNTH